MTSRATCLLFLLLANAYGDSSPLPSKSTPESTPEPTPEPSSPPKPGFTGNILCPNGYSGPRICHNRNNKCPGEPHSEVCLRDIMDGSNDVLYCCGHLNDYCPATRMHSYHSLGDGGFLHQYDSRLTDYYKRNYFGSRSQGVACPLPYSYTLKEFSDTLPVDWNQDNAASDSLRLKTCRDNNGCGENEFCDATWNPTFRNERRGLDKSDNGAPLRFCYKLPSPEPNMAHVKHNAGLKLCDTHVDCQDPAHICHVTKSKKLVDERNATLRRGYCMSVSGCESTDFSKGMVLPLNNHFCSKDIHCQGAGVNKDPDFGPTCRSYLPADTTRKLCCYEKLPACRFGIADWPIVKCSNMKQCLDAEEKKMAVESNSNHSKSLQRPNHWCNDEGGKHCCKDLQNRAWQCPDLATPLFNEPMCEGWTASSISSGSCSKKGGICHRGHCCPGFVIKGVNGSESKLGEHNYVTEFPCDPDKPLPAYFNYAFCEPESKRVSIVGKFHDNGDSLTKVAGSKCTKNKDCSSDNSRVCLYINSMKHECFYNPLKPLRKEVSLVWKVVLIISLCCSAVFLFCTILMFVCYRSKSVLDTYKKKGKKGKKGKGSKTSKNKKNKKGEDDESKSKKDSKDSKSKDSKSKESKDSKKEESNKGASPIEPLLELGAPPAAPEDGLGATPSQINNPPPL